MSNDLITSAMTQGCILFSDSAALRSELRATGRVSSIASVDRVTDRACTRLATQLRDARVASMSMLLTILVAAFCSLLLAAAHAERWSRIDLLLHIHGAADRIPIAIPLALTAVIGVSLVELASIAGLVETSAALVSAFGVVALDAGLVGTLLGLRARRIRSETLKTL